MEYYSMKWTEDFKENTLYRIDESTRMIEISFEKLEDHFHPEPIEVSLWKRPNAHSNSLGNLILHICGNMTQYVMTTLGEQEDDRNRELEFETKSGLTKTELLKKLHATVSQVKETIHAASEVRLLTKQNVQGFHFSGMGCVIHAVEHYSYHTGQIAFWVKQLIDKNLGFYDGMDLTITKDD